MEQTKRAETGTEAGHKRALTVVEALASTGSRAESLAEVAHDARNMVAALGVYCDLLEEPGVLSASYSNYAAELRLVTSASRRLVEKLVALDGHSRASSVEPAPTGFWRAEGATLEHWPAAAVPARTTQRWDSVTPAPVANLAADLLSTRNLLAALAGSGIGLTMDVEGGARAVRITAEDLTRVLVNLVKNSVEAMPGGGRIQIGLTERTANNGGWLVLTVEDSGPGIPEEALERIFESGYTGHKGAGGRPAKHRGLGLAITRAIVETAGGRIEAANREQGGARFQIELPAAG
jgi:signal transduction histidine kinase